MEISRNQVCPCGSGKKYKKCCMDKARIIDIHKIKEERFYEQKDILVRATTDFLWERSQVTGLENLQQIFYNRIGDHVDEKARPMMFQFFTLFIHRYENGLRGIEWFLKENRKRLDTPLMEMLTNWTNLKFRLVSITEIKKDIILFEDIMTKKVYPLANIQENVPSHLEEGYGTIGLLELHNSKYYFNGVRVFKGPLHVAQAKRKIEKLMEETGLSYESVLMEYTLEVMGGMMADGLQVNVEVEDVSLIEDLGMSHLPAYTEDFLSFFKEKTLGKKGNTVRKYRESLYDLNELLVRNQIISLEQIDKDSWKRLLSLEYFNMYETMTKTQITDFISTLKAFTQWMKRTKNNTLWLGLSKFLKVEESQFNNAVKLPNSFFPIRIGNMKGPINELVKILRGEIVPESPTVEGLFEIIRLNKQSFRVSRLEIRKGHSDSPEQGYTEATGEEYTISGSDLQMEFVEEGLLIFGIISKGRINMWELLDIKNVYPRSAKPFI
ncbi:SEC-C domain-containing protein [Evansella tamaricis]|nr:SEC-C metal-binding domain-containing protein [Evansella tamaricis]